MALRQTLSVPRRPQEGFGRGTSHNTNKRRKEEEEEEEEEGSTRLDMEGTVGSLLEEDDNEDEDDEKGHKESDRGDVLSVSLCLLDDARPGALRVVVGGDKRRDVLSLFESLELAALAVALHRLTNTGAGFVCVDDQTRGEE